MKEDIKTPVAAPNINLGFDDKIKIVYPREPVEIGTTKEGQPIWFDPKDLILSQDQKLEQGENMAKSEAEKALHNARLSVAARVEVWMGLTILKILPESFHGNKEQTEAWLKEHDVNFIEDTSVQGVHRFILRIKDKVLSEFVARIEPKTFSRN
jgi:hypothetical protein